MSKEETITSMGQKLQLAQASRNAALEENTGLLNHIKKIEKHIQELEAALLEAADIIEQYHDNGLAEYYKEADKYRKIARGER